MRSHWVDAARDFVWIAAAGIALGLALGRLYVWIQRPLRDPLVEVLLSLTLPYVAYLGGGEDRRIRRAGGGDGRTGARALRARDDQPETRLLTMTMWSAVVFLFNALIFIIIGMQLRPMLGSIAQHTAWQIAGYTAALTATAVAVRLIWVFPGSAIGRALNRWRHPVGLATDLAGEAGGRMVRDARGSSRWSRPSRSRTRSPRVRRFRSGT